MKFTLKKTYDSLADELTRGAIGAVVQPTHAPATKLALDWSQSARDFAVAAADQVAVGAVVEESEQCSGGGSITITIDTGNLSQVEFTNAVQFLKNVQMG